jgi:hypothetical protein
MMASPAVRVDELDEPQLMAYYLSSHGGAWPLAHSFMLDNISFQPYPSDQPQGPRSHQVSTLASIQDRAHRSGRSGDLASAGFMVEAKLSTEKAMPSGSCPPMSTTRATNRSGALSAILQLQSAETSTASFGRVSGHDIPADCEHCTSVERESTSTRTSLDSGSAELSEESLQARAGAPCGDDAGGVLRRERAEVDAREGESSLASLAGYGNSDGTQHARSKSAEENGPIGSDGGIRFVAKEVSVVPRRTTSGLSMLFRQQSS